MEPAFNDEKYQKSSIKEKIALLKNFLPKILVENKEAYSILSKGVHELKENECLDSFELLLSTIELILEEILITKENAKMEATIKKGI